jgi:hypothetical protein
MKRVFHCFPDRKAYPLEELETHLKFTYLPQIAFETPADKEEIRERGIEQWRNNKVSAESQELGNRFIREIESTSIPDVSIRWLEEILGYGLFLEETLESGSYAGEYTGIVRKNDLRRYFEPLNNYCDLLPKNWST